MIRIARVVLVLTVSIPTMAMGQAGWRELDVGSGRRAVRYLPASVRPCDPLPLLVFLHGAGGTPEPYQPHLAPHADATGMVLVLPQASGTGWSGADVPTIQAALDALGMELNVDGSRTYFGGHSAGGAFAYLLTYQGSTGIAAVFSMSAPYYEVSSLSDPEHRAPIRMYYGADDPNYTGGAASALERQWAGLGVTYETDVQPGFGHGTWPATSIQAGLEFLAAQRHPSAAPPSRCGDGQDAGVVGVDAGVSYDAGAPADATVARDAGVPEDGGGRTMVPSGCGCRAGASAPSPAALGAAPAALLLLLLRSRRH